METIDEQSHRTGEFAAGRSFTGWAGGRWYLPPIDASLAMRLRALREYAYRTEHRLDKGTDIDWLISRAAVVEVLRVNYTLTDFEMVRVIGPPHILGYAPGSDHLMLLDHVLDLLWETLRESDRAVRTCLTVVGARN